MGRRARAILRLWAIGSLAAIGALFLAYLVGVRDWVLLYLVASSAGIITIAAYA